MEFTSIEKMAIIFFLGKIMEADSIIHPKELEFMDLIYEKLDVSPDNLSMLEMMDLEYCKGIISGMTPDKLSFAKESFVGIALSDGYYDPKERILIDSL